MIKYHKKRYLLCICVVIAILLVSVQGSLQYKEKITEYDKYEQQNAYFYMPTEKQVEYEGYFYTYSYRDIWQNINLNITELKSFKNGILYTLELDQLDVTDPMDEIKLGRRYLGYFYVTDETIYYAPSTAEGYTDEENKKIIDSIQTDEIKFLKECNIVCCEDGTDDIVDENGYYAFVEVDGEKRIYRFYNDYFYGSKDYVLIVWEKGIIYYMHGNGAKNMHIEFGTDLREQQGADYGYPYKMFH